MATIFFDDDMSASVGTLLHNHVPSDVGTAWMRHSWYKPPNQAGTVTFRSDGSGFYPTVFGAMLAQDEPLSAEYDVEVDCQILTNFGNNGIIARASSTIRTFYHFYYQSGTWNLIKHINGLTTNLWTISSGGVGPGDTVRMKAEIRNATKKLFVDDGGGYDEIFSSTDNQITAKGFVGLRSAFQYGDNEGSQFTNFTATDTTDPPGRPRMAVI